MKFLPIALLLALSCVAAGPEAEKAKTMGNMTAPIRLDLFSDFTCPHCKMFHDQILQRVADDFITPGRAYLVFHDYVLTGPGHEHSHEAALYAAAAAHLKPKSKYAEVASALFAAQTSWALSGKVWETVSPVLTAAERTQIQTLVKDPAIAAEVQADVTLGNTSGVDRTPTLLISPRGKKRTPWSYWNDYNLFKSFMADQLK
jgi:protein-disulfide isomerase